MSVFLGANMGTLGPSGVLVDSDECVMPKWHKWDQRWDQVNLFPWLPGVLWSGSSFLGMAGGGTFGLSADDMSEPARTWDIDLRYTGGQQAKVLVGTTRDSSGNIVGNAIVRGFVTSTNQFVGQVTSDSTGWYSLPSFYGAVAHYLVAFKIGSPDIAGVSDNNLVPV